MGAAIDTILTVAPSIDRRIRVRGAVVHGDGQALRQRTLVVMPAERKRFMPDKRLNVGVVLERVECQGEQAGVRMEVVGVRFD